MALPDAFSHSHSEAFLSADQQISGCHFADGTVQLIASGGNRFIAIQIAPEIVEQVHAVLTREVFRNVP